MDTVKNDAVLAVSHLHLSFGGVLALDDVSFQVAAGEIFSIIGPNGAGKTCVVNCISGFYRPQRGEIYFREEKITRLRPDKIAALGVSRTFQSIQLYAALPVVDNLLAARHLFSKSNWIEGGIYLGRAKREEVANRAAVEEVIEFLELQRWRKSVVGSLPYGIRKRVDLGRALAQQPKLLLLDEPMAGMNAEEKEDMVRFILDVRDEKGIPIVLIEHDMGVVMGITDRIATLCFGRKIAEGSPDQIKNDPLVIEAYLGESANKVA